MTTQKQIPKQAEWNPTDLAYLCADCRMLLRFNSGLGYPIHVTSGDSSLESVVSWEEHVCNHEDQKRQPENYLSSQQNEIETQLKEYGRFESTAQFSKNREEQIKQKWIQKRQPLTEDHRKHIGDSVHVASQNRRELSFLAQNDKQRQAEAKELER